MRRGWWASFLTMIAFVLGFNQVEAHPGGVNAEGCHTAKRTGNYHCHGSRAPSVRPTPRPTPARAPTPRPASSWRAPSSTTRAPIVRSRAAVAAFRRSHPCPATGRTSGTCAGWEVDHLKRRLKTDPIRA